VVKVAGYSKRWLPSKQAKAKSFCLLSYLGIVARSVIKAVLLSAALKTAPL
jgi:hypothetical protein